MSEIDTSPRVNRDGLKVYTIKHQCPQCKRYLAMAKGWDCEECYNAIVKGLPLPKVEAPAKRMRVYFKKGW